MKKLFWGIICLSSIKYCICLMVMLTINGNQSPYGLLYLVSGIGCAVYFLVPPFSSNVKRVYAIISAILSPVKFIMILVISEIVLANVTSNFAEMVGFIADNLLFLILVGLLFNIAVLSLIFSFGPIQRDAEKEEFARQPGGVCSVCHLGINQINQNFRLNNLPAITVYIGDPISMWYCPTCDANFCSLHIRNRKMTLDAGDGRGDESLDIAICPNCRQDLKQA